MYCYEPGQMLILPKRGGTKFINGTLSESDYDKLNIIYSAEDILRYCHLDNLLERFNAFPILARVEEGEEVTQSKIYRKNPYIQVSIPNYHIFPSSSITPKINDPIISEAIDLVGCKVRNNENWGEGVKIALIDTGVNPDILDKPESLEKIQYSTDKVDQIDPYDPIGHGSVVAHIINKIAPSSSILSIKAMEEVGNLGAIITAIYLAEAEFKPDIYNFSMSFKCDTVCEFCGHHKLDTVTESQLRLLFELIDKIRKNNTDSRPLLVAAAGNNPNKVGMPASFPNVFAVGSYDMNLKRVASCSSYSRVPKGRFILAPGGSRDNKGFIASKYNWGGEDPFFGTSFSAAFVTGIAARYYCKGISTDIKPDRDLILGIFKSNAQKEPIYKYDSSKHGFGLANLH